MKSSMKKPRLFFWAAVFSAAFFTLSVTAEAAKPLVAIRETMAYKQFKSRPVSDFSKLIFLIDRFADSGVVIVYDGHQYQSKFAATVARWFLVRNYKKQTVKEWVMRWCNTSVLSGSLIWVKFPDGAFKLSREVLLNELAELDKVIDEDSKIPEIRAVPQPAQAPVEAAPEAQPAPAAEVKP